MCTLRPLNGTYWHNDCEIEEIVTKGSFSFPGYILGAEITVCNYLGSFLLESGNWKTLPPMGFSDPISLGKKLLPCYLRFSQPCFTDTELHFSKHTYHICPNLTPSLKRANLCRCPQLATAIP